MTQFIESTPAASDNAARPLAAAPPSLSQRLLRWSPLVPVAVGLTIGVAIADARPAAPLTCAVLFGIGCLIALAGLRRAKRTMRPAAQLALLSGLALAAAALGAVRCELAVRRLPADDLGRLADADRSMFLRVRGDVASTPRIAAADVPSWLATAAGGAGALNPREPRTRFLLHVRAVESRGGWRDMSGLVGVTIAAPVLELDAGQSVELFGRLYGLEGPRNPGEFDWARAARREGRRAGLYIENERCVRVRAPAAAGAARCLAAARGYLHELLAGDAADGDEGDAASLLDAMVLGQRRVVDRQLDDAFVAAGVVHFLCASGLNVVWLCGMVWMTLLLAGAHYRTQAAACIAAIVLYTLIAEPNPPILRAAITGALFFASYLVRRPRRGAHWLLAAYCLLLLIEPGDLFNAGFQLSFASVAGLILLTPALSAMLIGPSVLIVGGVEVRLERSHRLHHQALRGAATALALSVAAWLASAPIAAFHFGRLSSWGWLNSLVMSPLVFAVNLLGYGTLAVGLIWPGVGQALGALAKPAAELLAWLAGLLSRVPGCSLTVPAPGWGVLALYYISLCAALAGRAPRTRDESEPASGPTASASTAAASASAAAAASSALRRNAALSAATSLGVSAGAGAGAGVAAGVIAGVVRFRRGLGLLGMACAAAVWLVPWYAPLGRGGVLRVWFLAVGDGNATILELPNGRNIACDLGSRGRLDVGERTLVPFLCERGMRRLDAVHISHPDIDHFDGLPHVADRLDVRRVLLNPYFQPLAQVNNPAAKAFLAALRHGKIPIEIVQAGQPLDDMGDVRIDVIWPPADLDSARLADNDSSTVLRVTFQGRSILITGDVADAAMDGLLRRGGLQSDVLLAPHHGSVTAKRLPEFIEAVNPVRVIRSSGVKDSATSARLWQAVGGRSYYNTAECGAVSVRVAEGTATIECLRPSDGRPRR